jgi:hypothetical protein
LATLQTCGLLIRVAKPSYTTGTLCDIKSDFSGMYFAPPSMAVPLTFFGKWDKMIIMGCKIRNVSTALNEFIVYYNHAPTV